MTDPTSINDGRYLLVKPLGEGGMAKVYRAFDQRLQVWRAIKILLPQYSNKAKLKKRFEAEAQTMALLEHPHIVRVYDVGADGTFSYIVMEIVEGGCLVDWLEIHGAMPPLMAVDVTIEVCLGLAAAHSKGVIHRDVKPHNILVTTEGVCRVTDFGIARVGDTDQSLTKTGAVMGTWGYMAPEQRTDAKSVDSRADVYSTAATLYSLLTDKMPADLFLADRDDTMMEGIPEKLVEVLVKACEYRREDRHEDMDDFIAALEEVREYLPNDPDDTPSLVIDPGEVPAIPNPEDYIRRPQTDYGSAGGTILPVGTVGSVAAPTILPQSNAGYSPTVPPDEVSLGSGHMSVQNLAVYKPGDIPIDETPSRGSSALKMVTALVWIFGFILFGVAITAGGAVVAMNYWPKEPEVVAHTPPDPELPIPDEPKDPPKTPEPPKDPPKTPPKTPPKVVDPPKTPPAVVAHEDPPKTPPIAVVIKNDPPPEPDPPPQPKITQCLNVTGPSDIAVGKKAVFMAKLCSEDGTVVELHYRPRGGRIAWQKISMPFILGTHRNSIVLDDSYEKGLEYYITAGNSTHGSEYIPKKIVFPGG
ncbi:MAG: serine/threonine protein kinase [Proteobacteria bacterium]|jgi:serine/threonine protein kinase|nr:serine/threonine protein kinase [Pseudomonadota bacterium]